jgi:hypothetical protein
MQNPADYRRYAEECERMAKLGPPEHREALLRIAAAWRQCADEVDQRKKP